MLVHQQQRWEISVHLTIYHHNIFILEFHR